jgi:hypothetical protein
MPEGEMLDIEIDQNVMEELKRISTWYHWWKR